MASFLFNSASASPLQPLNPPHPFQNATPQQHFVGNNRFASSLQSNAWGSTTDVEMQDASPQIFYVHPIHVAAYIPSPPPTITWGAINDVDMEDAYPATPTSPPPTTPSGAADDVVMEDAWLAPPPSAIIAGNPSAGTYLPPAVNYNLYSAGIPFHVATTTPSPPPAMTWGAINDVDMEDAFPQTSASPIAGQTLPAVSAGFQTAVSVLPLAGSSTAGFLSYTGSGGKKRRL